MVLVMSGGLVPGFPVTVIVVVTKILSAVIFRMGRCNMILLRTIRPKLPQLVFPSFAKVGLARTIKETLVITIIVVTRALLSRGGFTSGGKCRLSSHRRVLTYTTKGLTTNTINYYPMGKDVSEASVGRRCKKGARIMSVATKLAVTIMLVNTAKFVRCLPIPMLATVMVSTLVGIMRARLTMHLFGMDEGRFCVFVTTKVNILFLNAVCKIIVKVLLSFITIVLETAGPPESFHKVVPKGRICCSLREGHFTCPVGRIVVCEFDRGLFFTGGGILISSVRGDVGRSAGIMVLSTSTVGDLSVATTSTLRVLTTDLGGHKVGFCVARRSERIGSRVEGLKVKRLVGRNTIQEAVLTTLRSTKVRRPYPLSVPRRSLRGLGQERCFSLPTRRRGALRRFT